MRRRRRKLRDTEKAETGSWATLGSLCVYRNIACKECLEIYCGGLPGEKVGDYIRW